MKTAEELFDFYIKMINTEKTKIEYKDLIERIEQRITKNSLDGRTNCLFYLPANTKYITKSAAIDTLTEFNYDVNNYGDSYILINWGNI